MNVRFAHLNTARYPSVSNNFPPASQTTKLSNTFGMGSGNPAGSTRLPSDGKRGNKLRKQFRMQGTSKTPQSSQLPRMEQHIEKLHRLSENYFRKAGRAGRTRPSWSSSWFGSGKKWKTNNFDAFKGLGRVRQIQQQFAHFAKNHARKLQHLSSREYTELAFQYIKVLVLSYSENLNPDARKQLLGELNEEAFTGNSQKVAAVGKRYGFEKIANIDCAKNGTKQRTAWDNEIKDLLYDMAKELDRQRGPASPLSAYTARPAIPTNSVPPTGPNGSRIPQNIWNRLEQLNPPPNLNPFVGEYPHKTIRSDDDAWNNPYKDVRNSSKTLNVVFGKPDQNGKRTIYTCFYEPDSPFSNWHHSPFTFDCKALHDHLKRKGLSNSLLEHLKKPVRFESREQGMFFYKYALCGRPDLAATHFTGPMKAHMAKERNRIYEDAIRSKLQNDWRGSGQEAALRDITRQCLLAPENRRLLDTLLLTEGTTLLEAAPGDRFYGIAASVHYHHGDPNHLAGLLNLAGLDRIRKGEWTETPNGQKTFNMLGKALTKLRDDVLKKRPDLRDRAHKRISEYSPYVFR